MKILIIASDKKGRFAPFIEEQIAALETCGVQILRYGITRKGIIGYLRELPALRRMIRAERPDIVHAHYGLSGLLANLQRRVPVVTTYHGSDINVPKILRLSKIAMRLSAWNIFVSKRNVVIALGDRANDECKVESVKCKGTDECKVECVKFKGTDECKVECVKCKGTDECKVESVKCKGTDECKVESVKCKGTENSGADKQTSTPYTLHPTPKNTLLPCGVNIPLPWSELQHQQVEQLTLNQWVQEKLKADVKHVLFAGAFDNAVKDPELAFAAVALLQTQCSGAEAPVYSVQCKGEETSEAVTSAQTPNTSIKLIELKGYNRDQVNALMYNCHALLLTSKTEGSPQVIKEAMACGCPIVSVDVGDVAERVNGVEGCYVVPTREPSTIAEALKKAIAFEGKTNGRSHIIEMGLNNEQVAKRLMAIYQSLV